MSRGENIAWIEQEAKDIASTAEIRKRLAGIALERDHLDGHYDYDWYFRSFMPVCAEKYGYSPGNDILISINAEYNDFNLIKEGMWACVWIWVSANKKLIDSAGVYFGEREEIYVSPYSGEIAIECIKQIPECFKAFCIDWFCFYSPFKDRYHDVTLSDSEIEQREKSTGGHSYRLFCEAKSRRDVWKTLWLEENDISLLWRDRIGTEVPQKEEADIDIRDWKQDTIHIQDGWFETFLKEREQKFKEAKKRAKEDAYSFEKAWKYWKYNLGNAMIAITVLILLIEMFLVPIAKIGGVLLFLISHPVFLVLSIWSLERIPFLLDPSLKKDVLHWQNVIQKIELKPFPKELKELAWLYHVKGYRISSSSLQPKNDLRIPNRKQYYGYMEELSTKYTEIDKDTTINLIRGYIPANVAAQLGMGKNISWKECYDLITGEDLILK